MTPRLGSRPIRPGSLALHAAVVLAVAVLVPAPGRAASQSDEDACRPDVFRLCLSAIPDETAIVTCLNAHMSTLGPACRAVLDPPRPSPTPAHPRRRPTAR